MFVLANKKACILDAAPRRASLWVEGETQQI